MDRSNLLLAGLVLAVIGSVVFLLLRGLVRASLNSSAAANEVKMRSLLAERDDFTASYVAYSKTSQSLLGLDEQSLQVTQYYRQGENIMVRSFPIASILSHQLLTDETTDITAFGSVLPGETSALGVGKAFALTEVRSISLRFLINSSSTPVVDHYFLTSQNYGKFDVKSDYVKEAMQHGSHMNAVLDVLRHRAGL